MPDGQRRSGGALDGSTGNAAGDSGAGEWAGTVTNTRVFGNSVSASSVAGDAIENVREQAAISRAELPAALDDESGKAELELPAGAWRSLSAELLQSVYHWR